MKNAHAQHTLASLFAEIENSDPRIDELGQNPHEFKFLNFAFNDFRDDPAKLTLSNVASWVEFFIECVGENVQRYCQEIESVREKRGQYWTLGSKQDDEDFFELLEIFSEKWHSADFQTKTEFVQAQHAVIAEALAERAEA